MVKTKNKNMEELFKLMEEYDNKHETLICLRIYKDGSGHMTNGHSSHIKNSNTDLFGFDNIKEAKMMMRKLLGKEMITVYAECNRHWEFQNLLLIKESEIINDDERHNLTGMFYLTYKGPNNKNISTQYLKKQKI